MNHFALLEKKSRRNTLIIIVMLIAVLAIGVACLFVGSSNMSFSDALNALLGGDSYHIYTFDWMVEHDFEYYLSHEI